MAIVVVVEGVSLTDDGADSGGEVVDGEVELVEVVPAPAQAVRAKMIARIPN